MAYASIKPEKPVYLSEDTHELLRSVSQQIEMPMQDIADEAIRKTLSDPAFFRVLDTYKEGLRRKKWRGMYLKTKTEEIHKAQKHDYTTGGENEDD